MEVALVAVGVAGVFSGLGMSGFALAKHKRHIQAMRACGRDAAQPMLRVPDEDMYGFGNAGPRKCQKKVSKLRRLLTRKRSGKGIDVTPVSSQANELRVVCMESDRSLPDKTWITEQRQLAEEGVPSTPVAHTPLTSANFSVHSFHKSITDDFSPDDPTHDLQPCFAPITTGMSQ
ncbi:hypothetical protein DIPPA_05285 [Diplonema papillatum]|nr:hypothetical protein DIPPA_05285 [Diplonema papillatum]